jgi:hypothetical protein
MRTIKLMADYNSHPLWEATPGVVGNVDPDDLPLSEDLRKILRRWADDYDTTLNLSDPASAGFANAEAEAAFKKRGYELAERLRGELGPAFCVVTQL